MEIVTLGSELGKNHVHMIGLDNDGRIALWRYTRTVGAAPHGAVTHPGAKSDAHVYVNL